MRRLRIASLISGGGSNNKAIIEACKSGRINGDVVVVGSDNPEAKGLAYAKGEGIPTFILDYKATKEACKQELDIIETLVPKDFTYDDDLQKLGMSAAYERFHGKIHTRLYVGAIVETKLLLELAKYKVDLLVLAGFMRILMPYFIDRFNTDPNLPRIINIHPALLPAFPGENGYEDTYNYGCKVGGCTVHFVDYGEDTGPIIDQRVVSIYPGETLESFKKRGLAEEWILYPACIQLFAEGRLKLATRGKRKIVEIN